jgi:hypothetical protein
MWRLLRDELRRRAGGNAFRSGLAGMTLFMEEVLVSRFTGGRPRAGQGREIFWPPLQAIWR